MTTHPHTTRSEQDLRWQTTGPFHAKLRLTWYFYGGNCTTYRNGLATEVKGE